MSLIRYLTKIHFADGIVDHAVTAEVEAIGARRPLLITEQHAIDADLPDRIRCALPSGVESFIFDQTPQAPTFAAATAAARIYREADCDCIIGLGGRAALDLSKAVGIAVSHDGPLTDYAAEEGGVARIKDILPPLIAIPTIAGTGSEAGRSAHLVLKSGRRIGLLSPFLVPRVAICDPTLTLGEPPEPTAGAGMDAITHCIETYVSTAYNPPADGIALEGLRRAAANIERTVSNGSDLDARREMMAASINGALALQKGLGGVHAASHALGGIGPEMLSHGALNGVLMPHVLEFNAPAVAERYNAIKQAMGLKPRSDLSTAISDLAQRVGLPARLGDMGINLRGIAAAAPLAEKDHTNGTNPRQAHAADYCAIMRAAL